MADLEYLTRGGNLPAHFGLESSNRCNVACRMCGGAQKVKARGLDPYYRLSEERIRRILKDVPLLSVTLAGSYAEPFLNKEIFKIAEYVQSRGGQMRAVTNGTLIGGAFADRIVEAGFKDLWVSLHGATPQVAEYVMEDSNFEGVIQNLEDLQAAKTRKKTPFPKVHIIFVALKTNIHELEGVVRLAKQVGAVEVGVSPLAIPPAEYELDPSWWEGEDLLQHRELFAEHYLCAERAAGELGIKLGSAAIFVRIAREFEASRGAPLQQVSQPAQPEAGKPAASEDPDIDVPLAGETRLCMFPFNKPYLDRTAVSPCCAKSAIRAKAWMGSFGEEGVLPVWDNERYRSLRTSLLTGEHLPDYCRRCERSGIVPKEVMILHVALSLYAQGGQAEPLRIIREHMSHYPLYLEHTKRMSVDPIAAPRFLSLPPAPAELALQLLG